MINELHSIPDEFIEKVCGNGTVGKRIDAGLYDKLDVKKGLRNYDGTGVVAGLTEICNVHGYLVNEGEKMPIDGELTYRGVQIKDLVGGCLHDGRFGFEETVYLLLFGKLPNSDELEEFCRILAECRELPEKFVIENIMSSPSNNLMNSLSRCVLSLYSYDMNAEDTSIENVIRQSIHLIAKLPIMVVSSYQAKRKYFDKKGMYFHCQREDLSTAENLLYTLRKDNKFTEREARILDISLMLHADHGGGNNSTFAARVLSSSGTDTYSAISAAIGSLKGPKHGGANMKVNEMMEYVKNEVKDWNNDDEISCYLEKILRRQAGDKSGLIYGMGHAVYTLSDPRAVILKGCAKELAEEKNAGEEYHLIESVERLAPSVFSAVKNDNRIIAANVDMYSGFLLGLMNIPSELFTSLFAIARISGWCAHRIEELSSGGKIIRPAYKSVKKKVEYIPLSERK